MKISQLLITILLLVFLYSCKTNSNNVNQSLPIEPIPFTARTMEDVPVYDYNQLEPFLNQENDTTYIINFWATWCKPCVEELPYFEELNKYTIGKKMKVKLVSLDFKKQLETKLIPFMNEHEIQSDVIVLNDPDSNTWIEKVDETWSGAIPVTLVYNAKNRLFLEMTFEDFDQIKNIVEKFNRES